MPVLPTLERQLPPGYLLLSEAAHRADVSIDTLRRRIRAGKLPAVRLGTDPNGPILVPAGFLSATDKQNVTAANGDALTEEAGDDGAVPSS
jgi:hypothetical protein